MSKGTIVKVSGPLVVAENMRSANMFDVVRVSSKRLVGEIIEIHGDRASIQVYEETSGLGTGETVESTGEALSVELGPGLIGSIFDGIQRPLDGIMEVCGNNLERGVEVPALKRDIKWKFVPTAKVGDVVSAGDIIGTVQETDIVEHKIMIPFSVSGKIKSIAAGDYTVDETVCVVQTEGGDKNITLMQKWPVRRARPYARKLSPDKPLITGQRVVDTMFPIAKGGVAAIPGPFGSGKTVTQHQLAKWAEADIVVYIGCGEMMGILQDEAELDEIVKLVGMDALSPSDRLKMETARSIREDFLHQLAFHEVDTYTSLEKQLCMMRLIKTYYDTCRAALEKGADIETLVSLPVREKIGRFKYIKEEDVRAHFDEVSDKIGKEISAACGKETD